MTGTLCLKKLNRVFRVIFNKLVSFSEFRVDFNPFHATGIVLCLLKHQETRGFLLFSGVIAGEQWHKMS